MWSLSRWRNFRAVSNPIGILQIELSVGSFRSSCFKSHRDTSNFGGIESEFNERNVSNPIGILQIERRGRASDALLGVSNPIGILQICNAHSLLHREGVSNPIGILQIRTANPLNVEGVKFQIP